MGCSFYVDFGPFHHKSGFIKTGKFYKLYLCATVQTKESRPFLCTPQSPMGRGIAATQCKMVVAGKPQPAGGVPAKSSPCTSLAFAQSGFRLSAYGTI